MWTDETSGTSTASPAAVYALLCDVRSWPTWNAGVKRIDLDDDFAVGAEAVMVFPDDSALPFTITWAEPGRGYEDLTDVPDAGVQVRVRHDLAATPAGTTITYRCTVTGGDPQACAAVGQGVTEDFPAVITALARAAEHHESGAQNA